MFTIRSFTAVAAFGLFAFTTACDNKDDPKGNENASADDDDDDDGGEDGGDGDKADDGDAGGDGDAASDGAGGINACTPGIGECADGEKCQPYVKKDGDCCVDAAKCVPITGEKVHGEACTRERYGDTCAKDVLCMLGTTGDIGEGTCYQLCDGEETDSCKNVGLPAATCNNYNDGFLPICDIPCNPIRPDACVAADGCYPFGAGFWCIPPDPEPGKGNQSDECNAEQSCHRGLYCEELGKQLVDGCGAESCCTTYCDLEGDHSECMAPAACIPFFAEGDEADDPSLIPVVGKCIIDAG
ncbi:MAG: hypothetical protein V3V08_19190 [Nannocystaceae bacterium]